MKKSFLSCYRGLLCLILLLIGCGVQSTTITPPPNVVAPVAPVAANGHDSPIPAAHGPAGQVPAAQAPSPATEVAEVPASEIVRELVIEQPATLYFISGHLYRPPFRLIQTKYKLIVKSASGSFIARQFPAIPEGQVDAILALPDGVTAKSSWQELDQQKMSKSIINNATRYFGRRYKTPEAAEKFSEYVKSLPFVKSVSWSDAPEGSEGQYNHANNNDDGPRQYLRVVTNVGDERDLFTSWWNPHATKDERDDFPYVHGYPNQEHMIANSPERLAWIKGLLDDSWRDLEHVLSDGDIFIFDSEKNVRHRLREPKVETLSQIGVILQKSVSKHQRSREIMDLLLLQKGLDSLADWDARLQVVIEYYDHSVEMQDWIKSIQALNAERLRKESLDRGTP